MKIKNEENEVEEIRLISDDNGKYLPILFALIISSIAILFDTHNITALMYPFAPTFKSAMISVAFLVTWILFGAVMGYKMNRSFIRSISLYWGIGCLLYLIGEWAGSTKSFTLLKALMTPIYILFLMPTYGLGYYNRDISFPHQYLSLSNSLSSIILSLLSGVVGFLLGYLLRKLRVSMLSDK